MIVITMYMGNLHDSSNLMLAIVPLHFSYYDKAPLEERHGHFLVPLVHGTNMPCAHAKRGENLTGIM